MDLEAINSASKSFLRNYTSGRPKMAVMRTADYLKLLGMGHVFLGILAFLVQIGGKSSCKIVWAFILFLSVIIYILQWILCAKSTLVSSLLTETGILWV